MINVFALKSFQHELIFVSQNSFIRCLLYLNYEKEKLIQ